MFFLDVVPLCFSWSALQVYAKAWQAVFKEGSFRSAGKFLGCFDCVSCTSHGVVLGCERCPSFEAVDQDEGSCNMRFF